MNHSNFSTDKPTNMKRNFSYNFSIEESPITDIYDVSPDVPEQVYIASSVFMACIGLFGVISNCTVFFIFCKSSVVSILLNVDSGCVKKSALAQNWGWVEIIWTDILLHN